MLYNHQKYLGKFFLLSTIALLAGASPSIPVRAAATDAMPDKQGAARQSGNVVHDDPSPSLGNYLSGRFAESLGDTDNGIRFLRESLKHNPDNKEMQGSLYRMLMLSGNIQEAITLAHKLEGAKVVEDSSEFSPAMLLAVEEIKGGQYEQAITHLSSIPKAGFNTLLVPLIQEWAKLGKGDIKAPEDAKVMMPQGHAVLPHVYLMAALIDDLAGFDKDAQKQYEAAVKDNRIEPFRAVEALANYYSRKGMNDRREQLVSDYLAAHGDSFLADELLVQADYTNAKALVNEPVQGVAEVLYTMANIFHGVRAPADEIATLHLALYLRPAFPAAQFLLASAYELAQDYPAAVAEYKTIDKESPYFLRGRIRSAYDEMDMGQKGAAYAVLDAVTKEQPKEIDALLAKGDLLRGESRYQDAITAYNEAVERVKIPQNRHWIIYFSRGACFERNGQWSKAEADMKKALELHPGQPDVLNYLGYSWLTMNRNIPQAKKMIEDAYDARPEDAHIIDSMGYAQYMAGDLSSAEEYFEQALERTPNDATVNDHLGDAYWQLGRRTEARYQWERALADNPEQDMETSLRQKLKSGLAAQRPVVQSVNKKAVTPESE